MLLFVLAYVGGVMTIVSPCILPVLPFVFARADRPFTRSGLPLLIGMAATFSAVATLASVGGGWAVAANQYARDMALAVFAVFGVTLLFPLLSARLAQPLVAMGARLSRSADRDGDTFAASLMLGVATGLLWAPCAGPILGLILTGAALRGASASTSLLLLAYAAGAATSLAVALMAGARVFAVMKRSLGAGEWVRRVLGVLVLAAVAAIALGVDTGVLSRLSLSGTSSTEQRLLTRFGVGATVPTSGPKAPGASAAGEATHLEVEGQMPALTGAVAWLNSPPLTAGELTGKVVLIDFWTYSCINCLRSLPYVRAWSEKYKAQGLVVIGVHTPEFAFEKNLDNVKKAVADLHVDYPVAIDSDYAIWRAFDNQYWPAHYFIDARGRVRHHHFGEGEYDESEHVIQTLLAEAGRDVSAAGLVAVDAGGVEAAPDQRDANSQETYIGYERAERFVSPHGATRNTRHVYQTGTPALNEWGVSGEWTIGGEHATLDAKDGTIVYRFHARDLHPVLGPGPNGQPVRFRVTIDGHAPGAARGTDVDVNGNGVVNAQRLYQLIRQPGSVADHEFAIQFLDASVEAFAFTFG